MYKCHSNQWSSYTCCSLQWFIYILDKFKSCPVHILEEFISCHKCTYLSKHSLFSKLKQLIFLLNLSPVKNVYIYLINDHDLLPNFETYSTINIKYICVISLQISVISTELDFKLLIYLTESVQVCHLLQIWFSKNHKLLKKIKFTSIITYHYKIAFR